MFNSVLSFKVYFQKDIDWLIDLIFSIVTNLLSLLLFYKWLAVYYYEGTTTITSYKNSYKKYLSKLMQSSTYRANTA